MKTAMLMLVLVGIAMTSVEGRRHKGKRFLIDDPYNAAKDEFNKVTVGYNVDFDTAVQALIPYIHSDMTVFLCTNACIASASSVLGPGAALIATIACPPLCDGALAYLEEQAG